MAILRSHLWDIDRLINRTLAEVANADALLAHRTSVSFLLCNRCFRECFTRITLSQSLSPLRPLLRCSSRCAIAFKPATIDRRFYRRKYDAAKTLEAFSATLRSEVELSELRVHLLNVVQDDEQPSHFSLWLRSPEHDRTHQAPWSRQSPC